MGHLMRPGIEKSGHPLMKMSGIRQGGHQMKNDCPLPGGRYPQFYGIVDHYDGKNQRKCRLA